jgi:hypothetical protein
MRALSWCLPLFLLLPQCGGGGSAATLGDAKSADDATSDASSQEAQSSEESAEDGGSEPSGEEKSGAGSCDDGTCSPCGSGICPVGWYCDEKAGACSWLTECAEKPTCGCVTRVLGSACKCREEAGGLKVACD